MIIRRLALASLLFSPLAWGADLAPPAAKVISLSGAEILPIKVSDASKAAGDSLKPPSNNRKPVDFTAVLSRSFDENGHPHYQCDADHTTAESTLTLPVDQRAAAGEELP